ncbi:MAG: hypothetical protein MZV70_00800 [Desulfobacterales bacterium]|nr:hypothetical protein [Desulfobacterales bacterium]
MISSYKRVTIGGEKKVSMEDTMIIGNLVIYGRSVGQQFRDHGSEGDRRRHRRRGHAHHEAIPSPIACRPSEATTGSASSSQHPDRFSARDGLSSSLAW